MKQKHPIHAELVEPHAERDVRIGAARPELDGPGIEAGSLEGYEVAGLDLSAMVEILIEHHQGVPVMTGSQDAVLTWPFS